MPPVAVLEAAPRFEAAAPLLDLGEFRATAYGPPWDARNGIGVTKRGTDLRDGRPRYVVAVDPGVVPLGSRVFAWPNPFDHTGPFVADDIGSAILGNCLDFYDWRGRVSQFDWGVRPAQVWVERPAVSTLEAYRFPIALRGEDAAALAAVRDHFAWFRAGLPASACAVSLRVGRDPAPAIAELRSLALGAAARRGLTPLPEVVAGEAVAVGLSSRGGAGAVAVLLDPASARAAVDAAWRRDDVRIVATDCPLVARWDGRLHPFPLGLPVEPLGDRGGLDTFTDLRGFRDRIEARAQPLRAVLDARGRGSSPAAVVAAAVGLLAG